MATLLQVKNCHADASQIQRLTRALVQKEGEVKILNAKISTLEKEKVRFFRSGKRDLQLAFCQDVLNTQIVFCPFKDIFVSANITD